LGRESNISSTPAHLFGIPTTGLPRRLRVGNSLQSNRDRPTARTVNYSKSPYGKCSGARLFWCLSEGSSSEHCRYSAKDFATRIARVGPATHDRQLGNDGLD